MLSLVSTCKSIEPKTKKNHTSYGTYDVLCFVGVCVCVWIWKHCLGNEKVFHKFAMYIYVYCRAGTITRKFNITSKHFWREQDWLQKYGEHILCTIFIFEYYTCRMFCVDRWMDDVSQQKYLLMERFLLFFFTFLKQNFFLLLFT